MCSLGALSGACEKLWCVVASARPVSAAGELLWCSGQRSGSFSQVSLMTSSAEKGGGHVKSCQPVSTAPFENAGFLGSRLDVASTDLGVGIGILGVRLDVFGPRLDVLSTGNYGVSCH